mmetsp:Transcript_95763/g.206659  ORF Transcript_95763/g.206659 Transcript_95763/m.206659 type:complete len:176 (-) Transcript_95763:166-693(-)
MPDFAVQLEKLRSTILKTPVVEKYAKMVEEKTKVHCEYIAVGLIVLLAIFVFFGLGASFICNLVGLLYPMYASVKAIESKDSSDDTQWLTYWIVYGVFGFLETFIDLILYWLPFFYAIKIAFLVWCMHPTTKGATVLYNSVIRPVFLAHEEKIDSLLNSSAKAAADAADESKKDK